MHGQSFDIMKLAAKMLVNTLGENDHVNIASFSRQVEWVTPCLNTLVQANTRNKRLLFDGIDRIEAHYVASYDTALQFAFEAFERYEVVRAEDQGSGTGADCHKLIMMFSDGGIQFPEATLNKYMASDRNVTNRVRIFTYAIGPHPLPTVALKKIACATKGSFETITAMGAIRTKIQVRGRVSAFFPA